jgi:hypothetical protein
MTTRQLEQLALDAHRTGRSFTRFWNEHAADVRQIEPYNQRRAGQIYARLMNLVLCGDDAGMSVIADDAEPWLADDALPVVSDSETRARYQGQLFDLAPID